MRKSTTRFMQGVVLTFCMMSIFWDWFAYNKVIGWCGICLIVLEFFNFEDDGVKGNGSDR